MSNLTHDQWIGEVRNNDGVWKRFTDEPINGKEMAEAWVEDTWQYLLKTRAVAETIAENRDDRVRVVPYLEETYRQDLLERIEEDAVLRRRALDVLSTEMLSAVANKDW